MHRKGKARSGSDQTGRRAPQKIGDLLTDLLARRGYAEVTSHEDCREAWCKVVGTLAECSRATAVKRGVLQVVVSNSVMMQELTFRKAELITAMANALPKHNVKDLRFKVGKLF